MFKVVSKYIPAKFKAFSDGPVNVNFSHFL